MDVDVEGGGTVNNDVSISVDDRAANGNNDNMLAGSNEGMCGII